MSRSEYINEWCVSPDRRETLTAGDSNNLMARNYGNSSIPILNLEGVSLIVSLLLLTVACSEEVGPASACTEEGSTLNFGFYAHFAPVSHSGDEDPASDGYNTHVGYEADLLTALEAMKGANLTFSRKPVSLWDGIWLKPAGPEHDIVGGGITILDTRTRNAEGEEVIAFTSGHIAFRQSLLVRAEYADRLSNHAALTSDVRVGALIGTTGEARMLVLTGLTDAEGVLVAGTHVETPEGEVTTDGSPDYFITAAGAAHELDGRTRIRPPSENLPQVVYLPVEDGQDHLVEALAEGAIDAVAKGEIGNRDDAYDSGGAFVVTALDSEPEYGGFSLAAGDAELRSCLDDKIDYLTDGRRIGYAEWREDSSVFMRRAEEWNEGR